MLSPTERDLLERREARVFEVLDYASRPVHWIIGGVQFVFLLLVFAGIGVVSPIYYFLHGGRFSTLEFVVGCAILGFLVILFGAPYYFVFGGAIVLAYLLYSSDVPNGDAKSVAAICVWECIGLLHVGFKVFKAIRRRTRRAVPTRKLKHAWAELNAGNTEQADQILFAACKLALELRLPEDHRYWREALALETALGAASKEY